MSFRVAKRSMVGTSEETVRLYDEMGRVAPSNAPVLILGDTGTGKELVARTIHELAPRGSFVTVDCSSLAGALLATELFGCVRGAFTGAIENRHGLLALADGGTAFFDEIGELPLDMQANLLRVLQEKRYRPVGALQERTSDFRIIAATNRNLALEVERGAFRRDLYYRLNVVTLHVSPLCRRRTDIPCLVDYFMRMYGDGHFVTGELMELMQTYDWPGNVRELENALRQMIVASHGPALEPESLPPHLLELFSGRGTAPSRIPPRPAPRSHPIMKLEDVERRAITRALEHTRGDRTAAAKALGIGRTTLYRRLKELDIETAEVAS